MDAVTAEGWTSRTGRTEISLGHQGITWLEHDFVAGRSRVIRDSRAITPAETDVGTLNWEYGGGSYLAVGDDLVYSDRSDLRLYRLAPGGAPTPLTPEGAGRYADGSLAADGRWAAYVHERHHADGSIEHAIVAVDVTRPAVPTVVVRPSHFVAWPRISPDGGRLAWVSWSKPRMPWDGTELWVGTIAADRSVSDARRIVGGTSESILSPAWSPDGTLHWLSDRSGWWNLYALVDGSVRAICPERAEDGAPPWHHAQRSYDFMDDGSIVAVRVRDAVHQVVHIDARSGRAVPLAPEITWIAGPRVACHRRSVAFIGASATQAETVFVLELDTCQLTTIRSEEPPQHAPFVPAAVWVRSELYDAPVHGFLYQSASSEAKPPLILQLHGGPTDAARLAFDPELQLWAYAGFMVLDLNYSGSAGFGSAYRHRLDGEWGRRDLADCLAAVDQLVADGLVDRERIFVRGASAGGYLTLCCVTAGGPFAGGAARCAIADVGMWRNDAHDYESRYVDMLIGPPSDTRRYSARSPAHNVGADAAPLLLIHGLGDKVVPPQHSRMMAEAYERAGKSCESVWLADEPHGARRQDSRRRRLEAELAFFGRLLAGSEPS